MPATPSAALRIGDVVDRWEGEGRGPYTVTDEDLVRVHVLRGACIAAAWHRSSFLYSEIAPLVGLATQGLGRWLDLLSEDCLRRDEPSLAALVVKASTGEPGDGFLGNAAEEREQCYRHWREARARRSNG